MMPVSFQSPDWTTALLRKIQRHYLSGYFTQAELAEYFNVSSGLVGKACRIAKENGGEAIAR
jgi:DNA-binding transcriptional regulator LsrR (DeoR family)